MKLDEAIELINRTWWGHCAPLVAEDVVRVVDIELSSGGAYAEVQTVGLDGGTYRREDDPPFAARAFQLRRGSDGWRADSFRTVRFEALEGRDAALAELEEQMAEDRPKPVKRRAKPLARATVEALPEALGAEGFEAIIMLASNCDDGSGPGPWVVSEEAVAEAEKQLGTRFPAGYRTFVTRLGHGLYGGRVRVSLPADVVSQLQDWRARIEEFWFWGETPLSRDTALECIRLADTNDGDELVFHPADPDRIYLLPRHAERVRGAGRGFSAALAKFVKKRPASFEPWPRAAKSTRGSA